MNYGKVFEIVFGSDRIETEKEPKERIYPILRYEFFDEQGAPDETQVFGIGKSLFG